MVKHVEELTVNAQLYAFRQLKPLGQIQVAPEEIRPAQCVPTEVADLAILRTVVAASASARARIDNRNKSIRIEPLDRSRLRDAGNWIVFVKWHAGNHASVLWAAALNDAVSIRGIGRAQNRKRQAAMPKHGARALPSVQRSRQQVISELDRQLINVLRREVLPHVVVAGAVLAAELARQWGKNGAGGEWEEPTV